MNPQFGFYGTYRVDTFTVSLVFVLLPDFAAEKLTCLGDNERIFQLEACLDIKPS
ncbi:hypothetical protein EGR_04060 [Echinococcus granulosus]|uniref:Uncharacterized protein n=1 Tax=Echinococcus granulosus TaxID=6210 RepID=W6URT2_ECHGR|nr:hypothetical protein EGR_04060 [Echinococcus granulosus]EUB61027.1 hypothetical protein EGR_04060 [Echinococcus granulosus]